MTPLPNKIDGESVGVMVMFSRRGRDFFYLRPVGLRAALRLDVLFFVDGFVGG